MTDLELYEACEELERAQALELAAAPGPRVAARLGLSAERVGDAVVLRAREVDSLLLNRTVGIVPGGDAGETLRSVIGRYGAQGIERYFVHLPADAPELAEHAAGLGLVRYPRRWIRFVRGREAVPPPTTDLRVELASHATVGAMARVLADGFDMPQAAVEVWSALLARPGWHLFVAREGEQVGAAGVLFVRGAHAFLAGGATAPAFRGRYAQGALMAARLRLALDLGCSHVFTETGELKPDEPNHSENNMRRCGFRPLGACDNWTLPVALEHGWAATPATDPPANPLG